MRRPWTELYLHLVWATWDRLPLITEVIRGPVYACIQAECKSLGAEVIAVGGVDDHVHLLVRVPASLAPAMLVKQAKGASSHLVNHQLDPGTVFKWQGGYGAFSVSKRLVPKVRDYILRQEEHHRSGTTHAAVEPE